MSQKPPHASGAEAPEGSDQLFELVADLLKVSAGERRTYRDMGLELCQAKIDDIVKHVHDPDRGAVITQDVIGRLFLLQNQMYGRDTETFLMENQALSSSRDRLDAVNQKLHEELGLHNQALAECSGRLQESERAHREAVENQAMKAAQETRATALGGARAPPRETEVESGSAARRGGASDSDASYYSASRKAILSAKPRRPVVASSHHSSGDSSRPPTPVGPLRPQAVKKEKERGKSHKEVKFTHRKPPSSSPSSSSSSSSDDSDEGSFSSGR